MLRMEAGRKFQTIFLSILKVFMALEDLRYKEHLTHEKFIFEKYFEFVCFPRKLALWIKNDRHFNKKSILGSL